jgi:hypothetical protein
MPYYVNMVDTFLSGWGGATGGLSRYSIRCDTFEQAETVKRNAKLRSEMKYVTISSKPPRATSKCDHVKVSHFDDVGSVWKRD